MFARDRLSKTVQVSRWAGTFLCVVSAGATVSCPGFRKGAGHGTDSARDTDAPVVYSVAADSEAVGVDTLVEGEDASGVDGDGYSLLMEWRSGVEVALEDAPLTSFYNAITRMTDTSSGTVRVLQYGDSHTAADFFTTALRRTLQRRFGDGGRGFVLLGTPWRSYRPKDIDTMATGNWHSERILISADPATLDGLYGLAGISVETEDANARSILTTTGSSGFGGRARLFEVFYLAQPDGGHFEIYVDNRIKGTVSTRSDEMRTAFFKIAVEEGHHTFEVRTRGDGKVRLFGAVVESGGPGIVWDTLGVNGGFFHTSHRWNKEELQAQIARRNPGLVVTMYGTNDVDSRNMTPDRYKRDVLVTMERFLGGAREADCLILGPPDRVVGEEKAVRLQQIIDVQREVAGQLGCGFMDLRGMMGGTGAHERWQRMSPPLAQPDGVHLTVRGYMALGEAVAARIIDGYDQYRHQ